MEILGIFVGIVLGLFGSIFSVWQFLYLRKHDKEQMEYNRKRDAEIDHKDRMMFLAQVIMDKDIKKESRQPFYDEYISKGGNGSFIRYWLSE